MEKSKGLVVLHLFPDGPESEQSPDEEVHNIVNSNMNEGDQVETTAHEAYGHGYFYDLNKAGKDVDPYHNFKTISVGQNEDGEMVITVRDVNEKLKSQNETVESQARANYNSRKKKRP